jgi:glycosyltransferase involved in cell wall biosynthesis
MIEPFDVEPRISAIIPVFNRETTIARAIESVLAQTRRPVEILVIDDGSSDSTAAVVATYGEEVKYVFQPNAGASVARNRGVERATTPWVAFLDSDDCWQDDHIERMADAIRATEGAAGFYFADTVMEDGMSLWEASGFTIPSRHCQISDATDWVLMDRQPTMLQSSVFNRMRFLKVGGLSSQLSVREDTHLFLIIGIRSSACAVAAGGTLMTSEDESGRRLTEAHGPSTRDWWLATQFMYEDVLRHFPNLERRYRRRVQHRLAAAEVLLARTDWRDGAVRGAVWHLGRAFRVAPGHVAVRSARKMARLALGRPSTSSRAGNGSPEEMLS